MIETDACDCPGFSTSNPGRAGSPATVGVTTHDVAGAVDPAVAPPSLPTPIVRSADTTGAPSRTERSTADGPVVGRGGRRRLRFLRLLGQSARGLRGRLRP